MKLLNRTTLYLSATFALIMAVWAFLMYLSMLDEIYDSIDDGLDNYKLLIIEKAKKDPSILMKSEFNESNYAITPITASQAVEGEDRYSDTLMYMRNENDFEPVRILHTDFEDNGHHYHLQVITSMVEEDDLIADLLTYLILLYGLIIVSVVVVNNVLLRRIWRPFHSILSQLKMFDLREPSPISLEHTNVTEFNEMAHAVKGLLRKNIDRYNSQKHFIENASHELQTPLAICINKLELLLEDENLASAHGQTLADVLDTLTRLTRLNKALILITSIENRQYAERGPVNFNDLITKACEDFEPLAEYHSITVSVDRQSTFIYPMNRDLALILVTNLVRNAIIHNRDGGSAVITVHQEGFKVTNSGPSGELDTQLLFTRFYRDRQKPQSLGLGLSIVHGICELSGLAISYSYGNGSHTFSISVRRQD